jgi:hypothetical protein
MPILPYVLLAAVATGGQSNLIGNFNAMDQTTTEAPISCRTIASASGDGLYSLHFELRNRGTATIELPTYEPFTAFSVAATADGKRLTVHQPALDIAVQPKVIHIDSQDTVTLTTPIRLRISDGAKPGNDGFVWTIAHKREAVSLQIKLNLPAPYSVPCVAVFE